MRVSERPTASARIARRGPRRQRACRGCQRAHVERVAGRKGVFALAGERDAVDDGRAPSCGPGASGRRPTSDVGQQRGRDGDQQSMVAGTPQRLRPPTRGDPAGCRKNQEYLFVGGPGESARDNFRAVVGVFRHGPCDDHVGLRRLYGNRSHHLVRTVRFGAPVFELSDSITPKAVPSSPSRARPSGAVGPMTPPKGTLISSFLTRPEYGWPDAGTPPLPGRRKRSS